MKSISDIFAPFITFFNKTSWNMNTSVLYKTGIYSKCFFRKKNVERQECGHHQQTNHFRFVFHKVLLIFV